MKTLLHCCCGPCSIYPVKRLLQRGAELTCFFSNPNIHPFKEFSLRLNTFKDFVQNENLKSHINSDYGLVEFTRKTVYKENERCLICYLMRIEETVKFAAEHKFQAFTTTLLYSKFQKHDLIASLCKRFSSEYSIQFFYEDFRAGWQEGIDRSIDYGMYRQPYCGCIYSEQERYDKSLRKKNNRILQI